MMRTRAHRSVCVLGLAFGLAPACSSDDEGGDDSSEADSDSDDDPSGSDGDGNGSDGDDSDEPTTAPVVAPETPTDETLIEADEDVTSSSVFGTLAEGCEATTEYPEQLRAPTDIIFVVDNSSSMAGEIEQIEARINDDLTEILNAAEVDYRVIMVARYGDVNQSVGESDHPICIHAPLGANDCSDPNNQPLVQNAPRFFHYSADVRSREPWCDLLEGFSTPDELKRAEDDDRPWSQVAPIGWRQFLREEAFKHFIVISDDDSECERIGYSFRDDNEVEDGQRAAVDFDTALLALSPRQFGSNDNRNYKWHSIVGLPEYTEPLEPWPASEPIQTGTCGQGSEGPGTGFQALSVLTEGLRYPSCNNENFNAVFRALADTVLRGSFTCEWEIPDVDDFSVDAVNVQWTDSSGIPQVIVHVDGENDCQDGGWYFDDPEDPETVLVCPSTCELFQGDAKSRVDLLFGCATVVTPMEAR